MSTPADVLIQWDQVKGLGRAKLDEVIELRRDAKKQVEAAQAVLDSINAKLFDLLAAADVKSVGVGETRVTLVAGGQSEKLDKKKLWTRLLELGVKEKVVVKAYADSTTVEERRPYVLVTEPKEKKG